jgi:threonyl-tRNA synthetase
MVHRALLGSLERFFGILIEHYAGAFPLWLAPEQVRVLPISEKFADYAETVRQELAKVGVRVSVDGDADPIGAKIRRARNQRIPYMAVVGEREAEVQAVALRGRAGEEGSVPVAELVARVVQEIAQKV